MPEVIKTEVSLGMLMKYTSMGKKLEIMRVTGSEKYTVDMYFEDDAHEEMIGFSKHYDSGKTNHYIFDKYLCPKIIEVTGKEYILDDLIKNASPNNYLFDRKKSEVLWIRGAPQHIDELVEILVDELSTMEIFPVGTKVTANFYGDKRRD